MRACAFVCATDRLLTRCSLRRRPRSLCRPPSCARPPGLLRPPAPLQSHGDPGQAAAAQLLEEGWAWGFDVDSWRAHLNALTWPEVARQLAIAAGLGRCAGSVPLAPSLPLFLVLGSVVELQESI